MYANDIIKFSYSLRELPNLILSLVISSLEILGGRKVDMLCLERDEKALDHENSMKMK